MQSHFAEIAQLVEHDLAKVGVASSSLVFRSKKRQPIKVGVFDLYKFFEPLSVNKDGEAGHYDGNHAHELDEDVQGRAAGVFERIAYGVTHDGSLVAV